MPICHKHLGYYILIEHTLVYGHLAKQQFAVKVIVRNLILAECMAYKQSCVAHVTFHVGAVFVQRQANVRVGAVETLVDHHRVSKPEECVVIFWESGVLVKSVHDDTPFLV